MDGFSCFYALVAMAVAQRILNSRQRMLKRACMVCWAIVAAGSLAGATEWLWIPAIAGTGLFLLAVFAERKWIRSSPDAGR